MSGSRFVFASEPGKGGSTGRDYKLGWRLTSAGRGFELGLEATRRENADDDPEHGAMLRGAIRW